MVSISRDSCRLMPGARVYVGVRGMNEPVVVRGVWSVLLAMKREYCRTPNDTR